MNNEEELPKELQEFTEQGALIYLPEKTIEVEIIATVYINGEIHKVSQTLSNKQVQESFKIIENSGILDEYVLTDEAIDYITNIE